MPLLLADLNDETRKYMVEEIDLDLANGALYLSQRLNAQGQHIWPTLIRAAAQQYQDAWLAHQIQENSLLNSHEQRRTPKGGTTMAKVPYNAHEMLAEGEFNRFYARGLCRRAIAEGKIHVLVYRAKAVDHPRPESEKLINTHIGAELLLHDLRTNVGIDTALGVPAGPNSGLSVRLD